MVYDPAADHLGCRGASWLSLSNAKPALHVANGMSEIGNNPAGTTLCRTSVSTAATEPNPSELPIASVESDASVETGVPLVQSHAESRYDPITGDWTIFAPNRQKRPNEFQNDGIGPKIHVDCPFCRGQEFMTPDPLWVGRVNANDGSYDVATGPRLAEESASGCMTQNWSVRVVPNLFPAVEPERNCSKAGAQSSAGQFSVHHSSAIQHAPSAHSALFLSAPVTGGHEVIIESPDHVRSFTELDLSDATLVLMAYRDRMRYWRAKKSIGYISVFKNVGGNAGASLHHCHSQLIATSQMPKNVQSVCNNMLRHHATTGCCMQCDILRAEMREKTRIVYHSDAFVAYCPFSSRLPMLLRLTSNEHHECFESIDDASLEKLSLLLKRAIGWVERLHPGASYNCLFHTRPPGARGDSGAFHWSIEIFPRVTRLAGFEWSSHTMINPVLPEIAASHYRACVEAEDPRLAL